MRIQKLIFKDFRQFRGEQSLTFSYDTAKNVTLVFGTNGAGKTTILNAIQWILYGEFSPDFEQPVWPMTVLCMKHVEDGFLKQVPQSSLGTQGRLMR